MWYYLAGWLAGWLAGRLAGWLAGWPFLEYHWSIWHCHVDNTIDSLGPWPRTHIIVVWSKKQKVVVVKGWKNAHIYIPHTNIPNSCNIGWNLSSALRSPKPLWLQLDCSWEASSIPTETWNMCRPSLDLSHKSSFVSVWVSPVFLWLKCKCPVQKCLLCCLSQERFNPLWTLGPFQSNPWFIMQGQHGSASQTVVLLGCSQGCWPQGWYRRWRESPQTQ